MSDYFPEPFRSEEFWEVVAGRRKNPYGRGMRRSWSAPRKPSTRRNTQTLTGSPCRLLKDGTCAVHELSDPQCQFTRDVASSGG
jgi:hypothetical protein